MWSSQSDSKTGDGPAGSWYSAGAVGEENRREGRRACEADCGPLSYMQWFIGLADQPPEAHAKLPSREFPLMLRLS